MVLAVMVAQVNKFFKMGGNKMKWNELIDLIDEQRFGESDVKLLTANNDIVDVMCVAIEQDDDVILIGKRV